MSVLYVSDLDGTLLQEDASLSDRARRRLTELLREGLPFTVASARSHASMAHILGDLPLTLPVIEFNGAFLTRLSTGEHLCIHDIDEAPLAQVYEAMRRHGQSPFLSTFDGERDLLYAPPATHAGMQWYVDERRATGDRRLRLVDDVGVGLAERVVCLTVIDRPQRLTPLAHDLAAIEGIDVSLWDNAYSPGWHWISVHDHRATKDRAVDLLLAHAGLGQVEVVAFGDQANDLGLLRRATRGLAVANAIDAVKAVADDLIGPNTADSVVDYIERDWHDRNGSAPRHPP